MWVPESVQRKTGTDKTTTTIVGQRYLSIVVTMLHIRVYFDVVSGGTPLAQIQNKFKQNKQFTVQYNGTKETFTTSWYQSIKLASKLLTFGPPLDGTHNYQRCFFWQGSWYCKRIYKYLWDETFGEIFASSFLMLAYQAKVIQLRENSTFCLNAIDHSVDFNKT